MQECYFTTKKIDRLFASKYINNERTFSSTRIHQQEPTINIEKTVK